jgi:hypothetical protein
MTNTEYNKLLKYLYFEGYANSYEEADYILEDMSNIERKQLMMEVLDTPQKTQSYAAKNAASAVGAFVRGDAKTLSKRFKGAQRGMKKIENRKSQNEECELDEATRMRKYFNKKYGNKNEYGENEAAAKEAITRRKISRNRTPYPHPPIRGSSEHLQFARQKAKSQNEAYEILLDYLIDEGYTNTVDGAVTIIENMSENWMESILEEAKTPKSPRNKEKTAQKAQERKERRLRQQYYGKKAVGFGSGEHLRPSN